MVRSATADDLCLLQQVLDDASGSINASIHGDDADSLLSIHHVYLGFVDGAVVGCIMATVDDATVVIHNLAVSRQYRNRGHATTLVRWVMTHLSDPIERTFWVAADPANPSTVKRFHLLGFKPHDDGVVRTVILMVRGPNEPTVVAGTVRNDPSREISSMMGSTKAMSGKIENQASND